MNAPTLMIAASLLFATMGVCVKLASTQYSVGEIVMYRGAVGAVLIALMARLRGPSLATSLPAMHASRATVGVVSLILWFYALAHLPLATAITLNYMSSVWMAVFLIGGVVAMGSSRVDPRLVATVLLGFGGVALVLQPTIAVDELGAGMAGLMSGVVAALAYLQVTALARAGEPEARIVFYFSVGSVLAGAGLAWMEGFHAHDLRGAALLLSIGLLATLAQLAMTRAYALGKPLVNASLQYLGIVFSTAYGAWLFDEALTWKTVAGMLLIVAAGLAATLLRARTVHAKDFKPGGEP